MMLMASRSPDGIGVERGLGQQPHRLARVAPHAAGQQRGLVLAGHEPAARQVLEPHRRAVLARDVEALRQLAGLGGQHVIDVLGAQQGDRGVVDVDRLAALVVHGDGLAERSEDAVEPRLRAAQLDRQVLVRVGQRGRTLACARGHHRERREGGVEADPVDRLAGARGVVPPGAADGDGDRHHAGDRDLPLLADDGEHERHEQHAAGDGERRAGDDDVEHRERRLDGERDREADGGPLGCRARTPFPGDASPGVRRRRGFSPGRGRRPRRAGWRSR